MKKVILFAATILSLTAISCSKVCHCYDTATNEQAPAQITEQYTAEMCQTMNDNSFGTLKCVME